MTDTSAIDQDPSAAPPPAAAKPDDATMMRKAYDMGLLKPADRAMYEKAMKMGLVQGSPAPAAPVSPAQQSRDAKSPWGSVNRGQLGADAQAAAKKAMGFDPAVDYETGAGFGAEVALQRADTPDEAQMALEKRFGKGNVGQDPGGRWWVKQDGKKVEVFGGGQAFETGLKKLASGVVGTSAEQGGMVLGAGLGEAAFPMGGGVPGAALGGMAGKGADELLKKIEGLNSKSPGQEVNTLAKTGTVDSLLAGVGPVAGKIVGGVPKMLRGWLGVTPEGAAAADRMMNTETPGYKRGPAPPLSTVAPGTKIFAYHQRLRNVVAGDPQQGIKVAYVRNELRKSLENEGMPKAQIDQVMAEAEDKTTRISTAEPGQLVTDAVRNHVGNLQGQADAALKTATGAADHLGKLYTAAASRAGDVGQAVGMAIQDSRKAVATAFSHAYQHIDAMTGGAKVIPIRLVKARIADMDINPMNMPPKFKKLLAEPGDAISMMDAQRYRSIFRDLATSPNLTPSFDNHMYGEVADELDRAFSWSEKNVTGPANRALRQVNTRYGEEIKKYKDAVFNKLVTNMKAGYPGEPRMVADLLTKEGNTARARDLMKVMPPQVRVQVAAAHMDLMLTNALKASGGRRITGDALFKILEAEDGRRWGQAGGGMLDAVYGPVYGKKFIAGLREWSKQLSAINGTIDPAELKGGDIAATLQKRVETLKAIDARIKDNYLGELHSGNPDTVDRAMGMLVAKDGEAKLVDAFDLFREGTKEREAIKKYALKDLLSKAIGSMPAGQKIIFGDELEKALGGYTKKQQELLFGDGLLSDLKTVSRDTRMLFPETGGSGSGDIGTSLGGASIQSHAFSSKHGFFKMILSRFWGFLADRPTTVRLLATGLRTPGPGRQESIAVLKSMFNMAVQEGTLAGPGQGAPSGGQ